MSAIIKQINEHAVVCDHLPDNQ